MQRLLGAVLIALAVIGGTAAAGVFDIYTNNIYAIDFPVPEENKTLSVTRFESSGSRRFGLRPFVNTNSRQRFTARVNSGSNIFTLFSEQQPWNWVEHIVEKTHFVNIETFPRVLGVLGGTSELVEADYSGTTGQQWYIVPVGGQENTGLLTNLLHRQCIIGHGEGEFLTLGPCNTADPNQVFKLTDRTYGRCY